LQEKEKKLEGLLRNLGLGDEKATVESALKELMSVKEQVAEESKPDVVHVPSNLVLLKRDDILKEGEIVVCAGDQLNADRSGKVVKASGQNVDVMFSKGGLDIVITFKKTDLARAPAEEVAKLAKAAAGRDKKEKKKKWTKADERNLKLLGDEMSRSSRTSAGPSVSLKAMRTSFNTVDVRGLRLRDAEVKVDAFIKQGIPQGRKCVYILHGHGTGQLKEGLREFMKRHPYVGKHRAADESDGGDAFTQVFMK
jgi:DNA mismatch repair protein MutS2